MQTSILERALTGATQTVLARPSHNALSRGSKGRFMAANKRVLSWASQDGSTAADKRAFGWASKAEFTGPNNRAFGWGSTGRSTAANKKPLGWASQDGSTATREKVLRCTRTAATVAVVVGAVLSASTAKPLAAQVSAPAVATPPTLGPAPRLVLPTVESTTLPNGLELRVVEMHEVPIVQAVLTIDGGARLDGELPGLATFTADMLDEGAAGRDAFELAAQLDFLGASLGPGASWNETTVSLRAPKRTFARALDLLADVVLRPTFAAADVKRQRDLRIADILQSRAEPRAIASLVFSKAVFPAGHPYHEPIRGDSASTARLDSATVRDFWSRAADPARATLIVAGDITLPEAQLLIEEKLGGWRSPSRPLTVPPASATPPAPRPATHVVLVDKPDAAQSVILIGAPGVSRRSDDYAALTLMNTILGGSFSSRLNQILREEKGFTYGAGSGFDWRPDIPGPFAASSAVRTNVTAPSLDIFFRQFERIRDEPVEEAELERARAYITLGTLGDFETTGQVAGQLAGLDAFGLALSTIPRELDAIGGLSAADVQQAAQQHLDPDHLTVVVVGDLGKIRDGIEALGLGPVSVYDVEGNPIE